MVGLIVFLTVAYVIGMFVAAVFLFDFGYTLWEKICSIFWVLFWPVLFAAIFVMIVTDFLKGRNPYDYQGTSEEATHHVYHHPTEGPFVHEECENDNEQNA